MALFSKKDHGSKRRNRRLVVTGKRVKGTWIMESALPLRARRPRQTATAILETQNRRVRTLH